MFLFLPQVHLRNWCLLCGCSLFILDVLLQKAPTPHRAATITNRSPSSEAFWYAVRITHEKPESCTEDAFIFFLIGLMITSREIKNWAMKGKLLE